MVKNSTIGKLRMVKAMTGRAIPRIRLLEAINVQICTSREIDLKEQVPEGVVLASKTGDKVEGRQPQEQQPGAVPHLQQVESTCHCRLIKKHKKNEIKVERARGHLDEAREAPVGERRLLAVHFRFGELVQLPPDSAKVQKQLKELAS